MTVPSQPLPAFPLPIATDIAPADTTDTALLDPRPGEQIGVGAVELRRYDDIVYRTTPRTLSLDLLRPASDERLPLLVYLPGGGFIMANKANAPVLRTFVAESGFVVASVEYRTASDNATYADSVRDVHAAIAYLRGHADDYGIDPRAVGVWGESAGGYVAAMTGVTNELARFGAGPGSGGRVDAVVDSFGASDLATVGADFDAAFQAHFRDTVTHFSAYLGAPGAALPEIPEEVTAADPATYASAATPPFLLLHGSKDMLISPSQTQHLHQALLAAGADSTRYLLEGANHGDIAFLGHPDSGLPWSSTTTMGIITAFLHRHLDRP
ncbi:hypothetical protein GCM10027258_59940 [Amycolatopsis stemonae]